MIEGPQGPVSQASLRRRLALSHPIAGMMLDSRSDLLSTATWLAIFAAVVVGCDGGRPDAPRAAAKSRLRALQGTQQNALFNSIRSQLRTFAEDTQTDLRPPTVVLDSRTSSDGEEVEAMIVRRPDSVDQLANLLVNRRGNGRFRANVRPGDIVKYYNLPDSESLQRIRETGEADIITFDSQDLVVAQVLSDDELLIEGGFLAEITVPYKIEIWRYVDDRMDEIQRRWTAYAKRREPPLGWQPSPDEAAIAQLTERLNQWLRQARRAGKSEDSGAADWARPALLATLPEVLTKDEKLVPLLTDKRLRDGYFEPYESRLIQGTTWRRDVADWARGGDASPVGVARSLFDWTVRNVQLVPKDEAMPRWPWELMLHGKASAAGRAWVFAGLCRQRNLTAVVVSVPTADSGNRLLVGVLDGDSLRLFDPTLGLPLPGAEPGSVATLAEITADETLLRRLDLPDSPYPLDAEGVAQATLSVVASPLEVTRRAARLSGRLTGADSLALGVDVDAVAARLAAAREREVTLWSWPFETLQRKLTTGPPERRRAVRDFLPLAWRPHLWKGRLLHFRGDKREADASRDALAEAVDDHRAALSEYMDRSVRPKSSILAKIAGEKQKIYRDAKSLATLWLATLRYDEGAYDVAKRWLENAALSAEAAESLQVSVRYNLARADEALGDLEAAIEKLEASEGPQRHGDRLRAARLKERLAEQAEAESDSPLEEQAAP